LFLLRLSSYNTQEYVVQNKLVIVQFSGPRLSPIGRTIFASEACRYSPAFISAGTEHEFSPNDVYLAEVVQTGAIVPGAFFSGHLVKPVRRIEDPAHAAFKKYARLNGFRTEENQLIVLGSKAQLRVMREPSLLPVLAKMIEMNSVTRLLSGGNSRVFHASVHERVGFESYVITSPISLDTPDTFAIPLASVHPVRVQKIEELEPTTVLSFELTRNHKPKHASAVITWLSTGMLTSYIEPTNTSSPEASQRALEFWCKHSHVYRPEQMSEPFMSTWREVIANARGNNAGTHDASADGELDGVLLPD
jgi:hypothetical protein